MKLRFTSALLLFGLALLASGQNYAQDSGQGKKGKGKFNFEQRVDPKFLRTNPSFVASFREVVAKPAISTVRIVCDGKDTALGMVVDADGWILTKANDLHGDIVCQLRDGREFHADIVGLH